MPDHPITISGGSPLTMQVDGGWTKVDPHTVATHYPRNTVTSIELSTVSGHPRPLEFEHQQCEIKIAFGEMNVVVFTDANGRNLQVATTDKPPLSHHFFLPKDKIQSKSEGEVHSLKILKAGQVQIDQANPGHIDIVIHYVEGAVALRTRRKTATA